MTEMSFITNWAEYERAEDEIVRVLDHRYSKGWT